MPKILLGVSSSFCANFLKGQVRFLVENGFEVLIISGPGEEISWLAREEKAKLLTIDFTKKITPLTDFFQLLRIIYILRREKPDIVNAGNPKSGFLIIMACWLTRQKNVIFTLHGLLSDTKKGGVRQLISISEKLSCRIAQKVLVVSHTLKLHAENRGILPSGKGIVIGKGSANGIDLLMFRGKSTVATSSKQLAQSLGLKQENIILGFAGRLSKDKGIDLLFEAFNTLVKDYPSLRMVIAGPIIEENLFSREWLHQLYHNEKISYLGKLHELTAFYGTIDILVLPSLREGFPNVLIEAAAMEIPVIASDIPGCRDAVLPGINGELFEKENLNGLVSVLKKLIEQPQLRQQYGTNGRAFVKDNFSNEEIWKGQLQMYRSML